ncbi:UDP-N-acetylglucosamine 4,6-dehydratase family protein [Porphyromonas sp.]|uniref:UDP-N-acetylglucosamine 4,6-dehydratase family protein n=1 Tax=Porphyromonas sp. TaxID=1924944 RepID=UPI003996769A
MKTKEFLRKCLGSRYVNYRIIALIDLLLSIIASLSAVFIASYALLTLTGVYFYETIIEYIGLTHPTLSFIILSLGISIIALLLFPVYKGIIRIRSFSNGFNYLWLSLCKSVVLALVLGVLSKEWLFGVLYFILDTLFTLFFLTGFRTIVQAVWSFINEAPLSGTRTPALIFGVNDRSSQLAEKLSNSYQGKGLYVIGFVETEQPTKSMTIGGKPIFYTPDTTSFSPLLDKYQVSVLLFSGYDVLHENAPFASICIDRKIRLLVDQEPRRILNVDSRPPIEEIQIEDILGRESIFLNMKPISEALHNKTILVTGATGSIGSEIVRQLARLEPQLIVLFDIAETPMHELRLELQRSYPNGRFAFVMGDIRNPQRLDFVMRKFHPDKVFHAAAYKHVPLMEENPCEAVATNIIGTFNIASKCLEYGVDQMVMLSTDKAVNPSSVMGATKRFCEIIVQSLDLAIKRGQMQTTVPTRFATTRFGNVLNSAGSVIPTFKRQLQRGGPLTVTDPRIERYFMTIPEASQLVLEASMLSQGGEVFVFDMGDLVKIADLAERMIRLAGYEPDKDIKIVYTGLRPGEKLYEETIHDKEKDLPTAHNKIHIVQTREESFERIHLMVLLFKRLARQGDVNGVVYLLKKAIPEYKSLNSELFASFERGEHIPFDLEEELSKVAAELPQS